MEEALALFLQSREAGLGWYGVAAAGVVVLVRGFRLESVQAALPVVAQWGRLKKWVQLTIVAVTSLAASWVTALMTGMAPAAALLFALPTAIAAVGGHKVSKKVGHAMTRESLRMDIGYSPSVLRKAVTPLLPMDEKAMKRAADIGKTARDRYNEGYPK